MSVLISGCDGGVQRLFRDTVMDRSPTRQEKSSICCKECDHRQPTRAVY